MSGDQLDRDDLIRGINLVIAKLRSAGEPTGIRIVGGAALALRYFDRRTTSDIDAHLHPEPPILRAAQEVAAEEGWPNDWLNSGATMFMPSFSIGLDWEDLYKDDFVTISVASPNALLAMKILASRPGRDVQDIANLLTICNIRSIEEAEELMDRYYPGDGLPGQALRILIPIFEQGLPPLPETPPSPILG
jgi:hypothetical protein